VKALMLIKIPGAHTKSRGGLAVEREKPDNSVARYLQWRFWDMRHLCRLHCMPAGSCVKVLRWRWAGVSRWLVLLL